MNFPRLSFSVLVGVALLIPFGASCAADDGTQIIPDEKLLRLQKQASEICAAAVNQANGQCDNIMAVMFEYQKQANREQREDRRASQNDRKMELKARQQNLDLQTHVITVQKQEAADRRDAAVAGATKESISSPCGSTSNPCPRPCSTQPC